MDNLNTEELYKLGTPTLLEMARQRGVKFPDPYTLPYRKLSKFENSDDISYGGIEDWQDIPQFEKNTPVRLHFVMTSMGVFRVYYSEEKCHHDVQMLNKRHVIVAMQSDNPNFPVLL